MAMNINLEAISELPCVSVSKWVFMQNYSYEKYVLRKSSFSYKMLCLEKFYMKTGFKRIEAQSNLEVACLILQVYGIVICTQLLP